MNFFTEKPSFPGEAGKFMGHTWMDCFDSMVMNTENGDAECCYLKTGKKEAGNLLDGKQHLEFPKV